MAGHGYSGQPVSTDIRAAITGVALVAVRGIADAFDLLLERASCTDSTQPNSWWNDWTIKCGEHMVLVGQDHSFELLRDMQGLQSGLILESTSTQEGLSAVLIQVRAPAAPSSEGLMAILISHLAGSSHACSER